MLTDLNTKVQNRLCLSEHELATFCSQWNIQELAVFGSVLRDDFQDNSDIDFLITFAPNARQGLLTLAKIKHELETWLSHPVDIAVKASIENGDNWIRRKDILATAQKIYEQR